ncbi:MAG: 30S ribosomal protein S13 [Candidatus Pacebacteria bacterium]|nr:30S ribosomal protein S13 [Candidatus Paceibacterota bacterium]
MRIAGITLPDNKRMPFALTSVYGIGRARAFKVLATAKVLPSKKPTDLSEAEEGAIRKALEGYILEGDLKREVSGNIKRLKDIMANRGMRHSKRLPVRGQRTKTNSRTVRGNVRKTMGSGKRKVELK